MIDLLICSVPSGVINRPPAAPAILKACAKQHGFKAQTIDLSLHFFVNQCHRNFNNYCQHSALFEPLINFDSTSIAHQLIQEWLDQTTQLINAVRPKFIAISVFSTFQHRATVMLCRLIRSQFPEVKIILGGYGLTAPTHDSFNGFLPAIDRLNAFNVYMLAHKLFDFQVVGEGESGIVSVLQGNTPNTAAVDLMTVPAPDFDDYNLNEYLWHTKPTLTVTGSKGCVRSCTFCNVPAKFGRYRKRTGQHIANEIIYLSQTYKVNHFEFTDSLVNGSQKDFYDFVKILAEYNSKCDKNNQITWYGQYICRPQSTIPQDIYSLIKQSGSSSLIIGAESGSNEVLAAMNKKITIQDVYDELEQFKKHNLQVHLLLMTGFYNETKERYLETLKFIVNCQPYLAQGVISTIAVGPPLLIAKDNEGGYLYDHATELGIMPDLKNPMNWKVSDDPSNTWLERIRRRIISQLVLNHMQAPLTENGITELHMIIEQLKIYEQELRSVNS